MKNKMKFLFTGLIALSFIAFTSCQKCYECKKDTVVGTDTERVCDGPVEADDRAENLEADGYTCTID